MPDTWNFSQKPSRPDSLAQAPILTVLLIGLSTLVTFASLTAGGRTGTLLYQIGNFGYASPEDVWGGRYWGLLTPVFIHGSWIHLLFDMIWLYQLGRILEATLSPLVYLPFLIAAAIVGSGCEMLVSGTTGIGMSGVVYAMFGLMWAGRGTVPVWGAVATRQNLQIFVGWGLFCVAATYLHLLSIANGAHGGGFLFGLSVGFLFFSPRPRWIWAVPLALVLGATILAATWQPWSRDWAFWKGDQEYDRGQYTRAIYWYQESLAHGGSAHELWNNISLSWENIAEQDQAQRNPQAALQAHTAAAAAARKAGPETRE